jgi:osmoprotectant transport system permease protein
MNLFAEAFDLIFDASRWSGSTGTGVRLGEHLTYTFLAIFLAALVAVPAGLYIGHTGRGRTSPSRSPAGSGPCPPSASS